MERQRSFSFKSTRFLLFSFTISSSIIFLTFFSFWIIKSTPSIIPETHLQLSKPPINASEKSISIETLTGFGRNFTVANAKSLILIDTQLAKPGNTSGFANSTVSGDTQRVENNTRVLEDEAIMDDGLDADSLSKSQESEAAPFLEEIVVQSNDKLDEKKIQAASDEKIELPIDQQIRRKKIRATSVKKIKDLPSSMQPKCWNRLEGKGLVFVGDSINRNQWESMLCMLIRAIRDPRKVYETHGRRITKEKGDYSFKFVDYKCTVEYYASHFLVHEGKARIGQKRVQTLRIDSIDRGSSRWRGADILIFNTAHWWTHYKTKAGINYYQEGNQVHPQLDVSTAFRRALTTWGSWVDKRINPRKTQVFFRNSAPSHFRGGQWNAGGHCTEATQPLNETSGFIYPEKNVIVEDVIKQIKTPVTLLNITSLSKYRIDGHPSIYGRYSGKRHSSSIQDCSHWCLPGVPDTWNELLYFHLQSK
ncbi:Protein trichome birefringence-like [Melia azedarach]|uniref:Protein trichome birefringence-like n=1 Tax=Melia azedarach TaxID=155640 RepID=A0ACC1YWE6_MELAZ|nr:Protein trichome birefringence-like [Melia azedarach]